MATLRIAGGRVVDPANGVNDEVRDVWIDGSQIISPPADLEAKASRTIDARGYVVMAGGVDVHSHIAGSKVNGARALRPEERRSRDAVWPRREGFRSGTVGQCAQHVRHGLPVRRAGLHDRGGCGDPSAGSPAGPCRVPRHALCWTS